MTIVPDDRGTKRIRGQLFVLKRQTSDVGDGPSILEFSETRSNFVRVLLKNGAPAFIYELRIDSAARGDLAVLELDIRIGGVHRSRLKLRTVTRHDPSAWIDTRRKERIKLGGVKACFRQCLFNRFARGLCFDYQNGQPSDNGHVIRVIELPAAPFPNLQPPNTQLREDVRGNEPQTSWYTSSKQWPQQLLFNVALGTKFL